MGPMENRMTWLRDRTRNHVADSPSVDPAEKILHFPNASEPAATGPRETALELVDQVADVLMSIEAQAVEIEVRAQTLARDACEKLRLAESRIQSLEAARRAAEQGMHEANVRAQEADNARKQAQSRAAAAEAEAYAFERRVKIAETRADKAQHVLANIEDAIRTKLLNLPRIGVNKRDAAA
jgi:hypothetical protein